mgnify:CR=1 FL=1
MTKTTPKHLPAGVSIAIDSLDILGEGPWWSTRSQSLWRVDIDRKLLHCWCKKDDSHRQWQLPQKVGCFVPNLAETAGVVALPDGLYWRELEDSFQKTIENMKWTTTPESIPPVVQPVKQTLAYLMLPPTPIT